MNTKSRGKGKNNFEKDFFKLINYVVFGKPTETARKYRDFKLIILQNFLQKI